MCTEKDKRLGTDIRGKKLAEKYYKEVDGVEISAWMKHPVQTAKPRDSIQHAREIMEKHRINQLPVVVDGRVVGIVTDRDLRDAFPSVFDSAALSAHARSASPTNPSKVPTESVMSPNVLTLGPKDTVVAAARLMRQERVGAIPIVDGNRLVGILTRSDVLDAFVHLAQSTTGRT